MYLNHPSSSFSQGLLLFRHAILLQLSASYPAGLPLETILQGLKLAGHPVDDQALIRELSYLKEKAWVDAQATLLSPSEFRYKLSAQGVDYLHSYLGA